MRTTILLSQSFERSSSDSELGSYGECQNLLYKIKNKKPKGENRYPFDRPLSDLSKVHLVSQKT